MKKIFTLLAGAAIAISASAQDSWWIAPEEAPAAGSTLVDDALLNATTVFETTCKPDAQSIFGVDFSFYMQVRIDKAPNADNPNGTDNGGSTPVVLKAKDNLLLTCYYRRQAANDVFTPDDGKDLKMYNKANFKTIKGELSIDHKSEDEAYAWVKTVYKLDKDAEYLLAARGTTLQLYGFSYAINPDAGGNDPDPGTDPGQNDPQPSRIGVTPAPNAIAYWYNVDGAADYTAPIGTFVADDGQSVNYANMYNDVTYMTIRVNGKKADVPTNAIKVTPTKALAAGDEIIVKAYRNKDTDAGASLYMQFENGSSTTIGAGGDGTEINNLQLGQQPNEISYTVTAAEAGSTFLYLSRDKSGTNIFIVAMEITDGPCGISAVSVDNNADAPVYNVLGQPVDASYKGLVIKNGRKYIQR